jgi:acetylornithine/succinyldiaminopimelate/putrescine aminotransferase
MVRFRLAGVPAAEVVERLRARGVLVLATDLMTIRAVTSLMVSAEDIRRAVNAIAKVMEG